MLAAIADRRPLAELVVDLLGDLIADVLLARGDHHLGAVLGHPLGDGAADAARGAGDDGDFSRHIEQAHVVSPDVIRRSPVSFSSYAHQR